MGRAFKKKKVPFIPSRNTEEKAMTEQGYGRTHQEQLPLFLSEHRGRRKKRGRWGGKTGVNK